MATQVRHNAAGMPPAAVPGDTSRFVPPNGVAQRAVEQGREQLGPDKAANTGREAKILFQIWLSATGQRMRLRVRQPAHQ
jgi:hypothetical protein